MPRILAISCVFALSACSTPPNTPAPQPVTTQENSQQTVHVAQNQQILCRTNNHLYPCIITSQKTPIGAVAPSASVTASAGPPVPVTPNGAAPVAAGTHAEHEAIAQQLREITATLGPLLSGLAEAEPSSSLPAVHPESLPASAGREASAQEVEQVIKILAPSIAAMAVKKQQADQHSQSKKQPADRQRFSKIKDEPPAKPAKSEESYKTTIEPELDDVLVKTQTLLGKKLNPGPEDRPSQATPDADSQSESSSPDQDNNPPVPSEKIVSPTGGSRDYDRENHTAQSTPSHLNRSIPKRKLRGKLMASVYFPSNSAELLPSEKIVLIDLLPLIRGKQLLFVGYSDRHGDKGTNTRLSYKRARAVKAFFLKTGHDPGKLFAGGKGSCCYKTEGKTLTGRRQNRRVEIYHTVGRLRPQPQPLIKE